MDNKTKTLQDIQQLLKQQKLMLEKKYKINQVGIFGSYIRGEQTQKSDLDILIDYQEAPSLITLIELEYYLSDIVGIKVDLVTKKGLKPQLKDYILKETVYL